jgi:hypothetical protein
MRNHIGWHFVNNYKITKDTHLCGYCGNIGCKLELRKTSGFGKNSTYGPWSDCSYFYGFSLKSAEKASTTNPCTNRPVACSICSEVYWSYNLTNHHAEKHSNVLVPEMITQCETKVLLQKTKATESLDN